MRLRISLKDWLIIAFLDRPILIPDIVRCEKCGATRKVDAMKCQASGWPECCGYTMTLISGTHRQEVANGPRS